MSDPSAQGHTNEVRHIIGEVENLRQDIKMLEAEIAKLREDPYAWYASAQRVNAELRERADAMVKALETISEAYAPSNHPEEVARAALAAYRDTKTCSDLCQEEKR